MPPMAERAAKRPKLATRGEDGYMPGNIIEIELRNFMTYGYLVCRPAPRLNLVIGPNGSGKSSIVCAIALGLAGEPQLLGRASNAGAYVKRGEDSGSVRIMLRGDTSEERINITRRIDTHNKSDWTVNGKPAAKRDVIEVIKRFNIQVSNLTQFLPQDRVCEFAKLTPIQLLEETEKAVGNPKLPLQHRALVEKSIELKRLEVTVKQNGETLSNLKALNAELEKDVERARQREKLLEKVESMKKKLPWLKYDMKKVEYVQSKEQETVAMKNLEEEATILNKLREPITMKEKEKAVEDSVRKKLTNLMQQNVVKRTKILNDDNHLSIQLRGKYNEVDDLKRQEDSRQERLAKAKDDLSTAEKDLENLPPSKHPKNEIEKLVSQISELQVAEKEKRLEKSEHERLLEHKKLCLRQCLDRLKDMENASSRLLSALKSSGTEKIFEAYEWLQKHKHEFRKEVYGPVLLTVKVPNREHAAYLEGHVPYYIWKSVITQDSTDRDLLVNSLGAYDVPVLNYVPDRNQNRKPFNISEGMRRLDICTRLDQIFDAPHAVKEVLISQAGLDNSYIGSAETDKKADEAPQLGIQDLWTPENHYKWVRSRYGGHVSAVVEQVSSSRLFTTNVNATEIENLKAKKEGLEESIAEMEQSCKTIYMELRNLENEAADLHKKREDKLSEIQLEKKKRRDMENRVVQRRKKLESIEREDDVHANTKRLMDEAAELNTKRFELFIEIKKLLDEAVSLKWSYAERHFSIIEIDDAIRSMELSIKQQEKVAIQAAEKLEYCKKVTERFRKELQTLKSQAELIAKITPELEQAFLQMPTTIEELDAAIEDCLSQANSHLFLNNNVLQEYESRQKMIDNLQNKLETSEETFKICLSEVENLKQKWLPALRDLVTQINDTFSHNFQEMAVAGEVSLDEHGVDFDKYGILIKVKFRQTGQLQVLSAHHQSGGERSVSTILYLVSLQDLTNCPFRVVDEINQGMDPINERKMFQQLVRAASQPKTPQCFLLTPKLLPGLEYSDACTVLNIFNGPYVPEASKAWSNGKNWAELMMGLVS